MGRRSKGTAKPLASAAGVRLRALLSLGMVVGLGAVGTLAAWTDQATATAQFSAGTVDLELGPEADGRPALTSLTVDNMYPGSKKAAIVTVTNTGTLPLSYNLSGGSDRPTALLSALTVSVYQADPLTGLLNTDGKTCTGAVIPALSSGFSSVKLLADDRRLQPGTSSRLCVQVELPVSAINELQNTTAEAVFTFLATQAV